MPKGRQVRCPAIRSGKKAKRKTPPGEKREKGKQATTERRKDPSFFLRHKILNLPNLCETKGHKAGVQTRRDPFKKKQNPPEK